MVRSAVMLLAALVAAGCGPGPDAPAPARFGPFIEGARAAFDLQDGGPVPATFRFVAARCRDDGGVVMVFEQSGGSRPGGLAVAMSRTPSADASSWAGGFAPIDPVTDPEVLAFFEGGREVPCA